MARPLACLAALALCAPAAAAAALTTIPAASPLVRWMGRALADNSTGRVYMDWEGVSATVTLSPGVSLLTATIIDACGGTGVGGGSRWAVDMTAAPSVSPAQHRVATFYSSPAVTEYVLFANPGARCDPDCSFLANTTFSLTRLTESRLSGCSAGGNLSLAALSADVAFAPPPPPSGRWIEIIGDSISSGDLNAGFLASGTGSPARCGNAAFNNDVLLGYGAALCRAFDSACMHTGWGGTTLQGMVPLYPFTFSGLGPNQGYQPYDFAAAEGAVEGKAVIINLGTNCCDTEPLYQDFAASVARKYYQDASVALFLAYGPMTSSYQALVEAAAANLTAGGLRAFALDLTLPHAMTGCFNHPSAADHAEIAVKAQPQIAKVMGW